MQLMKSYLETITEHAASRNLELKELFRVADLPTSTYYRTINGTSELRYDTAKKLYDAVDEHVKRRKYKERLERMAKNNEHIDRRIIRYK